MSQEEVIILLEKLDKPISTEEIANELKINLRTVRRTLKKLIDQELIFIERIEGLGKGRPRRIYRINKRVLNSTSF